MAIVQGAGERWGRVVGHLPGAAPRDAPLIELLREMHHLRGLRHRGLISAVEYERRRTQVLERI